MGLRLGPGRGRPLRRGPGRGRPLHLGQGRGGRGRARRRPAPRLPPPTSLSLLLSLLSNLNKSAAALISTRKTIAASSHYPVPADRFNFGNSSSNCSIVQTSSKTSLSGKDFLSRGSFVSWILTKLQENGATRSQRKI